MSGLKLISSQKIGSCFLIFEEKKENHIFKIFYNIIHLEEYQLNHEHRRKFGMYSKMGSILMRNVSNLVTIITSYIIVILHTIAYFDPETDQYLIVMIVSYLTFIIGIYYMISIAMLSVYTIFIVSLYIKYRSNEIMANIRLFERNGKQFSAKDFPPFGTSHLYSIFNI